MRFICSRSVIGATFTDEQRTRARCPRPKIARRVGIISESARGQNQKSLPRRSRSAFRQIHGHGAGECEDETRGARLNPNIEIRRKTEDLNTGKFGVPPLGGLCSAFVLRFRLKAGHRTRKVRSKQRNGVKSRVSRFISNTALRRLRASPQTTLLHFRHSCFKIPSDFGFRYYPAKSPSPHSSRTRPSRFRVPP